MPRILSWMVGWLTVGLLFFAMAAALFWYSLQEGLASPSSALVRYPNYNWPQGSSLLVHNGVVQSDYFIKYIQTIIQTNFGNVPTVSLSRLENLLMLSLNPTIMTILQDQYGSLETFLLQNKSSFLPFST